MQQPSAEVLRALLLTPSQFHVIIDLIEHPDGLKREALQHGASEEEVEGLLQRNLIDHTGEHYHATGMAKGIIDAIERSGLGNP